MGVGIGPLGHPGCVARSALFRRRRSGFGTVLVGHGLGHRTDRSDAYLGGVARGRLPAGDRACLHQLRRHRHRSPGRGPAVLGAQEALARRHVHRSGDSRQVLSAAVAGGAVLPVSAVGQDARLVRGGRGGGDRVDRGEPTDPHPVSPRWYEFFRLNSDRGADADTLLRLAAKAVGATWKVDVLNIVSLG